MLSLQECRKILGPACTLSDSQLECLREALYALADIATKTYPKPRSANTTVSLNSNLGINFERMLDLLSEAEREEAMERVSIMEFDGGLPRNEVEKIVRPKYFKNKNQRN